MQCGDIILTNVSECGIKAVPLPSKQEYNGSSPFIRSNTPVAQLVEALALRAGSWRFEASQGYHIHDDH